MNETLRGKARKFPMILCEELSNLLWNIGALQFIIIRTASKMILIIFAAVRIIINWSVPLHEVPQLDYLFLNSPVAKLHAAD